MPSLQPPVHVRYTKPSTGESLVVAYRMPCLPALMRAIESALARCGFERVEPS